ncbi:MAG: transposase [Bacteroidetes bacterium]|jgi:putative transposase|nr:transposase [Bacteroidota bacterium]
MCLPGGQRAGITQAEELLSSLEPKAGIVDKRYDPDQLVRQIETAGAEGVIPPKRHRREQGEYDRDLYADRNEVKRFFGRIKHYRCAATRYEKTARCDLVRVQVAAIMTLLL